MKIWKYLGWDTKEARTDRVKDTNYHGTVQWVVFVLGLVVISYFIWGS